MNTPTIHPAIEDGMNAREQQTVEAALAASTTLLTVRDVMKATGLDEPTVRVDIRRLAQQGQIEHIPGRGRYDGRYGLLRPIEKAAPLAASMDVAITNEGNKSEAAETILLLAEVEALKARLDGYDHAVGVIHDICRDAGIEPGLVHERVQVLANEREELQRGFAEATSELGIRAHTIANLEGAVGIYKEVVQSDAQRIRALQDELAAERQANAALKEQLDGLPEIRDAAETFIVLAAKRKPARITCPERARERALSAIRAGAQRASVYALVHVGTALRGAVFQEAQP